MTLEDAKISFGSIYKVCKALKIAPQNGTRWIKQGYIPHLQQFHLEQITGGGLKADAIDPKIIAKPNSRRGKRVKE
jgi:hypothetical protein